jgi:hypothetical protein
MSELRSLGFVKPEMWVESFLGFLFDELRV